MPEISRTVEEQIEHVIASLRTILFRITERTDPSHAIAFAKTFTRVLHVYNTQDEKYGASWVKDNLGPRAMFVEIVQKVARLRGLMWETSPTDWDPIKIAETIRDLMSYSLFTHRLLEIEHTIDELKVQMEVDKT